MMLSIDARMVSTMIVYCTQEALPLVSECKMGNHALVQRSCSTETDEKVQ